MNLQQLLVFPFGIERGARVAFDCVSRTHVGLRRKVNEDSMLVRSERGLWAVADGMGGHDAGDVASSKVTESLMRLPIFYGLDAVVDGAIAALQRVNEELIALAEPDETGRTIGSTVVGLAITDAKFCCFWAGDSRAYRIRDGEIAQLSRDHSLVQNLVDAGMLSPEEAETHPNSNIVTRAVGVASELKIDKVTGDALPGDLFILASDGLTKMVTDAEMLAALTSSSLEDAIDQLVDTVLSRGAPDNISVIVTRVE